MIDPNYVKLFEVLVMAGDRASKGKGRERHSHGEPFEGQYICRAPKIFGLGALLYQIGKKNEEIMKLDTPEGKINELLDIIVYAAAGVILLRGS
jgi:hypothetical protein